MGAIAKGARRTRSRLGGRLEPFSHVELVLHEGRGALATVTGAQLLRAHDRLALDPYRFAVGHIGLEAVMRLFVEDDENPQAFHALVRFLDLLDRTACPPRLGEAPGGNAAPAGRASEPALDPLALSFQLKLLWLAGYLPHLASCASCGSRGPLAAFSAPAGGAVCADCQSGAQPISAAGLAGITGLLERPLAEADAAGLTPAAAREALRVVQALYEYHGGIRLRTLAAR